MIFITYFLLLVSDDGSTRFMQKKLFLIVRILSVIGITLACYLLWEQWTKPAFTPCYINSIVNCDAIISGPVAKTLGIPTPLFGLVGYIVIFASTLWQKKKLLMFMAAFGTAFCLWIAYQEIVLLRVICPVCIMCQVIMLTILVLASKLSRMDEVTTTTSE